MDDNSDKYSGAVGMEIFLSIHPFQVRHLGAEFLFLFFQNSLQ
jgi:hypothetical protein